MPLERQIDRGTYSFDIKIEDPHFKSSAPALWDPRALQRVYYPPQGSHPVEEIILESAPRQPDPQQFRNKDECYQLDYPEETGQDLLETLVNENNNIIVTVWYENYQNQWAQNMVNQNVQGTLWRCICENHPNIIYTEADMSHYNRNAYSYEEIADQLGVQIDELLYGPTVVVMNDQTGSSFRVDQDPEKLLEAVEDYIRSQEKDVFGIVAPKCDLKDKILADNHYEHYLPNEQLEMYTPENNEAKTEAQKEKHVEVRDTPSSTPATAPAPKPIPPVSKPRFQLSEPEKAFN